MSDTKVTPADLDVEALVHYCATYVWGDREQKTTEAKILTVFEPLVAEVKRLRLLSEHLGRILREAEAERDRWEAEAKAWNRANLEWVEDRVELTKECDQYRKLACQRGREPGGEK